MRQRVGKRERESGERERLPQTGDAYTALSAAVTIEHSMFRYFGKDEASTRYTAKARCVCVCVLVCVCARACVHARSSPPMARMYPVR